MVTVASVTLAPPQAAVAATLTVFSALSAAVAVAEWTLAPPQAGQPQRPQQLVAVAVAEWALAPPQDQAAVAALAPPQAGQPQRPQKLVAVAAAEWALAPPQAGLRPQQRVAVVAAELKPCRSTRAALPVECAWWFRLPAKRSLGQR